MTRRLASLGLAASVALAAASIAWAPRAAAEGQAGGGAARGPGAGTDANAATPRLADGHPDLNGMWGGGGGGREFEVDDKGNATDIFPSRRCAPTQVKCSEYTNQSYDGEFTARMSANRPLYKPEYWDKVQYLDMNTNKEDPLFACQPLGVPRVGPPARILQTANDVVFLYAAGGASTQPAEYRVIPTDNRPFDEVRSQDVYFYGLSVGHWEGDTLVVKAIAFNDLTWLDKGGLFHSDKMTVTEKFTREGNALVYDVTVEDPEVLLEPWHLTPRRLRLNTDPKAFLPEGLPCKDYDQSNMVTQIRH
jgi:hypothetical protein